MRLLAIGIFSVFAYKASAIETECLESAVLNHEGICVTPKYIEGCFQYASNNRCHQCSYNYSLQSDGKCAYRPSKVSKSCCKIHDPTTGSCQKCEYGLILKDGKCEQERILGCINQDRSTGKCKSCAKSFYLENGDCTIGIDNCTDYMDIKGTDMKICNQCEPGHSLINNACLPNSILGCKDQEGSDICKSCYQPFVLKNSKCQVPDCQSHNQFGCASCQCGFYLTQERKCKEISQGCLRYNRGMCTDCMQHFKLKGNACDIDGCLKIEGYRCVECDQGYDSTELGCKMKNCMVWDNGVCEVCDNGYRQKDGKCVEAFDTLNKPVYQKTAML